MTRISIVIKSDSVQTITKKKKRKTEKRSGTVKNDLRMCNFKEEIILDCVEIKNWCSQFHFLKDIIL